MRTRNMYKIMKQNGVRRRTLKMRRKNGLFIDSRDDDGTTTAAEYFHSFELKTNVLDSPIKHVKLVYFCTSFETIENQSVTFLTNIKNRY